VTQHTENEAHRCVFGDCDGTSAGHVTTVRAALAPGGWLHTPTPAVEPLAADPLCAIPYWHGPHAVDNGRLQAECPGTRVIPPAEDCEGWRP
jgi:hypothetical protein